MNDFDVGYINIFGTGVVEGVAGEQKNGWGLEIISKLTTEGTEKHREKVKPLCALYGFKPDINIF